MVEQTMGPIGLIIPSYNVEPQLRMLLREIRELPKVKSGEWVPIVVDDCSSDDTSLVAHQYIVTVIKHTSNKGKGAALSTGFNYALEKGFSAVVTIDGDCQHDPASIASLIETAEKGNHDIVIGCRMENTKDMPMQRVLSNTLTSTIISSLARQKIPDSQSGFRFIKSTVLTSMNLTHTGYEAESELLIKAGRQGFKIGSMPIETIYNDEDETSHIRPVRDTLRFLSLILKSLRF